jgi:hypothetical protein
MNTRIAWLVCAIVLFGAYGVLALMAPSISGPPEIRITPPPPDLSPKLAALSGVWESTDEGGRMHTLVVERIDEARATILLIGRNHPPGYPSGGWERVRARVLRDGGVEWGYPVRFTLRVAGDGATFDEGQEKAEAATRRVLRKVGAFIPPTEVTYRATLTKDALPNSAPERD